MNYYVDYFKSDDNFKNHKCISSNILSDDKIPEILDFVLHDGCGINFAVYYSCDFATLDKLNLSDFDKYYEITTRAIFKYNDETYNFEKIA